MKRISVYLITLCAALALAFVPACTDDIELPVPPREEIPEGITLRIPDPGLAATLTRSEAELTEAEQQISSLYLIAFHDKATIVENLLKSDKVAVRNENYTHTSAGDDLESGSADGFRSFDITKLFEAGENGSLLGGIWRVYVAANIDPYLKDHTSLKDAGIESEEALKELCLKFAEGSDYLLQTKAPEKGLPMICLADEMIVKTGSNGSVSSEKGDFNLERSKSAVLHADMKYLVSKVRYTILFDSKTFSADVFGGKSWKLEGVRADNVYPIPYTLDGTPLAGTPTPLAITTPEREYPAEDLFPYTSAVMPESNKGTYNFTGTDLAGVSAANPPYDKRAYQATIYLPANTSGDQSELSISAKEQHKTGVADGADLGYTLPLLPGDNGRLLPSNAYDIVAKVTGVDKLDITVQTVNEWKSATLVYQLMPALYLHVDKTTVDIFAGVNAEIGFETNAPTVDIQGPTVEVNIGNETKSVELYKLIKTEDGKMYVGVNPEVPVDAFGAINEKLNSAEGEELYKHFYIIAGDIRKKIDIDKIILRRFLTVDPVTVTIDAREKIASGEYDGYIDVTISTNLSEFELNTESWATLTAGKTSCLNLANYSMDPKGVKLWANGTNNKIIAKKGVDYGDNGVMKLRIYFGDINKNNETFWSNSKQLLFTVRCDNPSGMAVTDDDYIGPREVTVNTLPNNDTYTVYFKGYGWDNPHIYIYQCLELPMSMSTWAKANGNAEGKWITKSGELDLSSYPVGYQVKDGYGNVTGRRAALEYLFSGSCAFKGWDCNEHGTGDSYFSNKEALTATKIGMGWTDSGFFMFDDASFEGCSWNPTSNGNNQGHRYFTDMGFNHEHQKLNICSDCAASNGNYPDTNGYPGIGMYYVDDEKDPNYGWWKFEISGLATPGKALIMFADTHKGNDDRRFPGNNVNGLPLFDFPNRIGYIELHYGTGSFSPYPGGSTPTETGIWFKNEADWDNVYAYVWKENGGAQYNNAGWPGTKMEKDATGNYYLNIDDSSYDRVIFNNGDKDGKVGETQTGNFTMILGKTYSFDGSTSGGGESHDTFQKGSGYLIKFNGNKSLWMWLSKNGTTVQEITKVGDYNWNNWPTGNGDYYFVADVDDADKLEMFFGSDSDKREIPASYFKWNGSEQRYEYTIE